MWRPWCCTWRQWHYRHWSRRQGPISRRGLNGRRRCQSRRACRSQPFLVRKPPLLPSRSCLTRPRVELPLARELRNEIGPVEHVADDPAIGPASLELWILTQTLYGRVRLQTKPLDHLRARRHLLNVRFIYLFEFLSSYCSRFCCWISLLPHCTSVVKFLLLTLLLLD